VLTEHQSGFPGHSSTYFNLFLGLPPMTIFIPFPRLFNRNVNRTNQTVI